MNADTMEAAGTVSLVVHEQKKAMAKPKPNEAHVIGPDGKTVLHYFRVGPTTMQRRVKKFSHMRINKEGKEVEVLRERWIDATDFWPSLPSWARRGIMETLKLDVRF